MMQTTQSPNPKTVAALEELILRMVQAVVDHPESIGVDFDDSDGPPTFFVTVHPSDIGYAIGKQGRIANAIRTVTKAAAMKNQQKVYVEVVTPAPEAK